MNDGLQNLIAASANNSYDMGWGSTKIRTFATSSRDGQRNTKKIISALGNNEDTPYAAQLCDDYEVDSEGNSPCKTGTCYSNWFLPAENQLYCLYDNAPWIAQFPQGDYWSSTEVADDKMSTAFAMLMISHAAGSATSYFKDNLESIRCVSIFNP
ncbi:protein with a bacterial immunoglobulin-like domain protein [Legionella santicrucis]|uniref:Protein with a bacterial immunoglobulin-like domain protein n=1 Tax=Legionella santicrucis TaxID=45074 RepID=A0A0W0Y980_9GAMM|nr:hypothetical protein [Legionella santicrucis]KTD53247.1 protein with a bacterial immunoglobulin-like domain protein [Legionella santicrucis]